MLAFALLLLYICPQLGLNLEIEGGVYRNLIVTIEDSVPSLNCKTILNNLEMTLNGYSQHLFAALDGRAFLQSATIILPTSWPNSCVEKVVSSGAGEDTDVTVLPRDPVRGKIWTQQSTGCGQPGDGIYLSYESLLSHDYTLHRSLVKEFAMYRYGIFEERGYKNDPIYPICYYDEESKTNKVTGCSSLPITDNGICTNPDASYNLTELVDKNARSSILFAAEAPSVTMFCDEGTHDRYAPTKQNLMCDRRSTFDIISNHADFAVNLTPNDRSTEITNTIPKITYAKQNLTRYVLVIESTKDMLQRESWNYLKVAIRKWALYDLPSNSEVGVLLAHETGFTKLLNILSLENSNSRDIISSNIPYTSGDSSRAACLDCAIKEAISMLKERTKYRNPAKNVIVVIAPGADWNAELEASTVEAKRSKIRFATINYPEIVRAQTLDALAIATNGVAYTVIEEKYNIDTSMLSTYFELTNVLYDVVERFYSGDLSDLSIEIHRRKLTDDGRMSITGSFVLDDNMGEPARFMVYTHNTDSPLIRSLALVSPSGVQFVSRSENMLNVKIISLAANISEAGTWTYTIERYAGNPQPHYVRVVATPRSRTSPVIRAKFWSNNPPSGGPLILLAEIKYGSRPILAAKVEVAVIRSEVNGSLAYSDTIQLLDTGSGDPDITRGDGIYSRYFSAAPGGPGLYTFRATITDNGNTAYTWQNSFDQISDACCGSNIAPTRGVEPLVPFQRVLVPLTIGISGDDIVKASQVPVGRIGDLKVQIKDMKALLSWTCPDLGGTRPARYEIKYSSHLSDVIDNYETRALNWEHATPHVLATGSETTVVLDMSREKQLLDTTLYFVVRAFPQMYSDGQATPISNWVRVLVPSPPTPSTIPPTFDPNNQTVWPNRVHSVDTLQPSKAAKANFGLQVILPIVIGVIVLAIILILYCYFCVVKRRNHVNLKKSDNSAVVRNSPLHCVSMEHSDLPDHHTVGVPINNFSFEDEPEKRYSLVHHQEQQLIEELKQHQFNNQQRDFGLSVISNNSLQRHTLSPYNSWSASQLLHEHERRYSPLDNMICEQQLLDQQQDMLGVDCLSFNREQYHLGHAPPVPPLPSNGYPANYDIYGLHQQQQMLIQQNLPVYQSTQRNDFTDPYSTSLRGSISSVNSGEKKRRNITMV